MLMTQIVVYFGMTIGRFLISAKNKGRFAPRYEVIRDFSPIIVAFVRDGTIFFFLYVCLYSL